MAQSENEWIKSLCFCFFCSTAVEQLKALHESHTKRQRCRSFSYFLEHTSVHRLFRHSWWKYDKSWASEKRGLVKYVILLYVWTLFLSSKGLFKKGDIIGVDQYWGKYLNNHQPVHDLKPEKKFRSYITHTQTLICRFLSSSQPYIMKLSALYQFR